MTPYDTGKISLAVENEDRPSREEAENAVRTLIRWAGDNPEREGLMDTPARVVRSTKNSLPVIAKMPLICWRVPSKKSKATAIFTAAEYPHQILLRTSFVPILGVAHIAYLPDRRVVAFQNWHGSSISSQNECRPGNNDRPDHRYHPVCTATPRRGAACRCHPSMHDNPWVHKPDVSMITTSFTGVFDEDETLRNRFLSQVK